jgi:hypothetical protein
VAPRRPRLLRLRPSRGLGEPALEALVGSTSWHGCSRCLLYFKRAPGNLLTHMPLFRELILSRARGSCRSRVLRGMGTRSARFTSSEPRATFSRRCPFEGWYCLEPGARAARGFCVAWVLVVPALLQAGPWRPSHADVPSRADIVSSQGLAPLEGSPCLARDRVIKCPQSRLRVRNAGAPF